MRFAFAVLFAFALGTPTGAAAAAYGPGNQAYSVVATAAADGRLSGSETISFTNTSSAPLREIWLRLWANDGCARPHITVSSLTGGAVMTTSRDCTAIKVRLVAPLPPEAVADLGLRFTIRLPHAHARLGTADGASFYGNALPVLATTRDGAPLLPPPEALGDPFVASAARWTIDLTWPRPLVAATGGTWTNLSAPAGMRRALFTSPGARDLTIAIGPWRESDITAAGTRIRMLTPAGTTTRALLSAARASFARMTRRYGQTGLRQLDVVITPGLESDGMEYAGLVLSEPSRETLVHEIAHQWFSQLVGSDGSAEPWLDEGPTTYAQLRELGRLDECDVAHPFAGYGSARLTWSLKQFARHEHWYGAVYDGAACALVRLDRVWGGSAVDGTLPAWVARHRDGIATTADFIALLRERAPAGYDVDAYLRYARLTP